MAIFNGTFGADRITTTGVSAGVTADPFGSRPGDGGDIILGQGGDDYLSGGGGNDWIVGGADDDTIHGDTGSDGLYGGDGDDLIYNASPSAPVDSSRGDVVYGGNGNDRIHAVHFGRFYGDDDDDTFIIWPTTQSGYFFVNGGRGSDTLDFSVTRLFEDINLATREVSVPNLVFREIENVIGNRLNNEITGDGQDNELRGAGGRDTIDGAEGDDVIWGDAGRDTIMGGRGDDEVHGGSGGDVLFGSWTDHDYSGPLFFVPNDGGRDLVYGGAGNDRIFTSGYGEFHGGAGNDHFIINVSGGQTVSGGSGRDTLVFPVGVKPIRVNLESESTNVQGLTFNGIENVQVTYVRTSDMNVPVSFVGTESDNSFSIEYYVEGASGTAVIDGRGGDDTLGGGTGSDWIFGGTGNDVLRGEAGSDWLHGGIGDDILHGHYGLDTLLGGDGADILSGGSLSNVLRGGDGADILYGGRDDDVLRGGDGADILNGGRDSDRFEFGAGESAGWSHDTIRRLDMNPDDSRIGDSDVIAILFDADTTRSGHQDFEFLGAVSDAVGLSHGAGHLWTVNTGQHTYVRGNVDGDRFLEFTVLIEDGDYASASDYTLEHFVL